MVAGPRAVLAAALAAALALAAAGCTLITDSFLTNDFSGDPFPVEVDTASGAIVVGMRSQGDTDHLAVLDLLSPITVTDPCNAGISCADALPATSCPDTIPSVSIADLTMLGERSTGCIDLPRATFPQAQLVSLHPCANAAPSAAAGATAGATTDVAAGMPVPDCVVGTPSAPRTFKGIIGADALAGDDVRLDLASNELFILPDIGGSDRGRTLSCDAVFDAPYRGGGTLVIAGTELPFNNLRIAVQACLGPDAEPDLDPAVTGSLTPPTLTAPIDPLTFRQHGADALFVVSTSIGISILGQSAYDRYRLAEPDAAIPTSDTLPDGSVYLPSGLISGKLATIASLALVAAPSSNSLSPCRQLYAHRLLTTYAPTTQQCLIDANGHSPIDCPCKDGSTFCPVPAIVELAPTGFNVLVVDDTDPTLQALRTELAPDQPEVDGILGTGVLRGAEIDVDYPHDRLIARCPGGICKARPELALSDDVCQIKRCFTGQTDHNGCPKGSALPTPCITGSTDVNLRCNDQ